MSARVLSWLALGAAILISALVTGCDSFSHACPAIFRLSSVDLEVHLPPEALVAPPETVTVCQETECLSAAMPVLGNEPGNSLSFGQPLRSGSVQLLPDGRRRLHVLWDLGGDPGAASQMFTLKAVDANASVTASLSGIVVYTVTPGDDCGGPTWHGALSD